MDNVLFWRDHGRIEVGIKSKSKDLCDDNGIMWLEQVVLGCPVCGGMVRDYPQNISSYDWCPRCCRRLYHKEESVDNE